MVSSGILTSAMDANELNPQSSRNSFDPPQWTLLEAIPEFSVDYSPPPPVRRVWLPVLLFFATCASTLFAGIFFLGHFDDGWRRAIIDGVMYSGAVMTILLCHEMGHFVQAWRYGVHASLPYFIPMPLTHIGTFGVVIGMDPRRGDRKAIFDIGISGPSAGPGADVPLSSCSASTGARERGPHERTRRATGPGRATAHRALDPFSQEPILACQGSLCTQPAKANGCKARTWPAGIGSLRKWIKY